MTRDFEHAELIQRDKNNLITALEALQGDKDYERAGTLAESLLLDYIGDNDIREAYTKIKKW